MADGLSVPVLRAVLVASVLAAVVVLAGVFPDGVRYGCVGVIVLTALVTIAARKRPGGGWWNLLGAGAALSAAGAAVAQVADTPGGLLAVIGGSLVVIGATTGYPAD